MLETEMTESFLVFIKDNFTKDTIPPEDDNPALIQSYKLRDSYIIGQLISVIIEKFLNKPDLFFGWKNLEDVANEMTAMNPLKRPSIKNGLLESSFFIDNLFFQISTNLEKFKSFPAEKKDDMFNQLYSNLLLIPKSTVIEYILPVILQHELFSESTEPVFHKLFKLEEDGLLNPQEYQLLIVPFIKKSINSKEFYVRMGMLALLPIYLDTCLSFLDSTWFDSVLDQVLSGLEEADDDLYVQSFMSLIFLIPRYMKIYDSDSLKNSSLQNLSSPTAGSIGSLNSPQVSRISRLSVSLESTSATSKAEIKKSANKKAVLDLIVNRVLIPHFLNITCSEKFDSSCKCDVFIEIISLWKELHTKEV